MTSAALDPIPLEHEYTFAPASQTDGAPQAMHTARFYAFNTVITLQAFGEESVAAAAFEKALAACRRYERLFSRTLPHSDISRINTAHGAWVDIADDTYDLLEASIFYCRESLGAFDITIGAVTRLWDFQRSIMPEEKEIAAALEHVDYRFLETRCVDGMKSARLTDPHAAIDVGGTAKGYIADALRDLLCDCGLHHFLINLGGNVVACGGKPDGSPFRVGVKDPRNPEAILAAVPIADGSVVTSGLYERAFTHNGTRYSHILDPATGTPIATDAESVTVVAARSTDCDGFSTTLCALGIERGSEFAKTRPELSAVIYIDADNKLYIAE